MEVWHKRRNMLYELSDIQVRNLLTIISNANIKGSEAPAIIELTQALQNKKVSKEPDKEPQ